ncbi:DNA binding protein [Baekduia alba]|uniref:substrate-binding domain-containing protein n=1 Tax=Baekduia alba TaxID=2997333 RepID=UPI002341EB5F|nr:substrate-binding domain-containing protein [Baekduia alba]WCB94865.1 DNA binding protein [Baekduia alba]
MGRLIRTRNRAGRTWRVAVVAAVACALALAVSACGSGGSGSGGNGKYGVVVLTKQGEFYVGYQRAMQKIAASAGTDVTVLDSDAKVEKQQQNVEDLLTKGVDAIGISPVDAASAQPLIKQAEGQKVPVVTVTVPTPGVPVVVEDSVAAGREGGKAAAQWFQKNYPNTPIRIAVVSFPQLQQTVDRAKGFVAGVQSVDPKARVVVSQDGSAVLDKATTAAENMLQAHPEANLWFGINDDSALGALNALKGAGRGTVAKKDLVVGFDGSAKGITEILNPQSAMKVDIGNQPYTYAKMAWDAMVALHDGKKPAARSVPPVTLLTPAMGAAKLKKFYEQQYGAVLPAS